MISLGVIAPGSNGTSLPLPAASTSRVMPGLTMKREPALAASSNCAGGEDGAGADNGFLDLAGGAADRLQRFRRPQGDLDHLQAASGQSPRQRNGIGGALDLQHRDNRLAVEQ